MNEQLQQALAEILNKTMAGVEAGTAFLQAELPDVIQQLLMWKLASAGIGAILWVVLLVVSSRFLIKHTGMGAAIDGSRPRRITLTHDEYGDIAPWVGVTWALYLVPVGLFFSAYSDAHTALQIWLAPKVYLIEYAASLAK